MKTKKAKQAPERLLPVHPGRILRIQVLEARGLTQTEFALATGLPVSRINDLVKERRGLTMDSAIRIATVVGTDVELWLNLQASYDKEIAMLAKGKEYAALKPLPLPLEQAA